MLKYKDISSEAHFDVFDGDESISDSSESSGEEEDGSIGDHKTKKVDEFSDFSEDDEEDKDDVRESRRATKKKQLEDVEAAMQGGARTDSSLYQPDKRSRQLAKQFFIHTLLTENNKDYRMLSPMDQEKVQDMVERGLIKDTVSQAMRLGSTVPIYYKVAKQVLGRMQDNELKNDLRQEKLVDGCLQLWQLAAFKTKDIIRLYSREQFVTPRSTPCRLTLSSARPY